MIKKHHHAKKKKAADAARKEKYEDNDKIPEENQPLGVAAEKGNNVNVNATPETNGKTSFEAKPESYQKEAMLADKGVNDEELKSIQQAQNKAPEVVPEVHHVSEAPEVHHVSETPEVKEVSIVEAPQQVPVSEMQSVRHVS